MDTTPLTPFQTPQRIKSANNSATLSTPLLVPPSPMLQQMGFGTGKSVAVAWLPSFQDETN